MAEILVYAQQPPDPQASFRKYDIISIEDDGFAWGPQQALDTFIVFRIPGKTKADLLYLKDPLMADVYDPDMGITLRDIVQMRRYFLNFDNIFTQADIDAIRNSDWLVYDVPLSAVQDKQALLP